MKSKRTWLNLIKRHSLTHFDLSIPSLLQPSPEKLQLPLFLRISNNWIRRRSTQSICDNSSSSIQFHICRLLLVLQPGKYIVVYKLYDNPAYSHSPA